MRSLKTRRAIDDHALGEVPGGAEFIARLMHAIQDLALLYAHTPDVRAREHLESYIDAIEGGITEAVGATKAPIILNTIRGAVMGRKHEIEHSGPTTRNLQ
jgi:cell division protein FtsX